MGLMEFVRIGGRLALLAGFAVCSLASADSISYFSGYSTPGLASWQPADPFAAQNVQFVPQVSLVSSTLGPSSPWGVTYGTMPGTGAYTGVNTGNDAIYGTWEYSSSTLDFASMGSSPSTSLGGGYSAYGSSALPSTTASFGSGTGFFVPASSYTNVNGFASFNAWLSPPSGGGMAEPPVIVAWQPIRDSALPAVSSNFSSPTVLPEIVPPSSNIQAGSVLDPLGTPEPASLGLMAAGLFGLLYLSKRR